MRRRRATAVVYRDSAVLLVRDRGHKKYSLPGGGAHRGESIEDAAARELREELGMVATSSTRASVADYPGLINHYLVSLVEATGDPKVSSWEVTGFLWWDGEASIPLRTETREILQTLARR